MMAAEMKQDTRRKENEMTANYQKVYSVNNTLQAIALQSSLENAGIPALIANAKDGAYIDIFAPTACADEARQLLNPERRCGEIYFIAR